MKRREFIGSAAAATALAAAPGIIAAEIVEDLESALEQMRLIAEDLGEGENEGRAI